MSVRNTALVGTEQIFTFLVVILETRAANPLLETAQVQIESFAEQLLQQISLPDLLTAEGGELFKNLTLDPAPANYYPISMAFREPIRALTVATNLAQRLQANNTYLNSQPNNGLEYTYSFKMALYTGAAYQQNQTYFGPSLNRAARLLSAAHSGQIVLGHATYTILDTLPKGVELINLGEHRLRNYVRPERIYQVVMTGSGPSSFPPLQTLEPRFSNLPAPTASLVGREAELARLINWLSVEHCRLVTLSGPDGVGKTRLALEVAHRLENIFEQGRFLVNLAALGELALVIRAISQVFGLTEANLQGELAQNLKNYLHQRQLLLILDGLETELQGTVGELVESLLAAAPGLQILLTSQTPLGLAQEVNCSLLPLPLPAKGMVATRWPQKLVEQYPGLRLFVERRQAFDPHFSLDQTNIENVLEFLQQFEGLPLALELAARADWSQPTTNQPEKAAATSVTGLNNTLDWVYELLEADEKRLFTRLAVFRGGAALDAITAVCNWKKDFWLEPGDRLNALRDKHLIRQRQELLTHPTGGDQWELRYEMAEPVRLYALQKLKQRNELSQTQLHQARFYLDLAEKTEKELYGPQQSYWLKWLDLEQANLRTVLDWSEVPPGSDNNDQPTTESSLWLGLGTASALWRYWRIRGLYDEGRIRLRRLLAQADNELINLSVRQKAICARAFNSAGVLAQYQSDYDPAQQLYEKSLALCRELEDWAGTATSLTNLGAIAQYRGDYPTATAFCEESITCWQRLPGSNQQKQGLAAAYNVLATLALYQGQLERAGQLWRDSLNLYRNLGDLIDAATPLSNLAGVAVYQGDYLAAEKLFGESLGVRRLLGEQVGVAMCLNNLGAVAQLRGDYQRATTYQEESLVLYRELGDKKGIASVLTNLGSLAFEQGEYKLAASTLLEGLDLWYGLGDKLFIAASLEGLAELCCGCQQYEAAPLLFGAAELLREINGTPIEPHNQAEYDKYVTMARQEITPSTFEASWQQGRQAPLDQVISYANGLSATLPPFRA